MTRLTGAESITTARQSPVEHQPPRAWCVTWVAGHSPTPTKWFHSLRHVTRVRRSPGRRCQGQPRSGQTQPGRESGCFPCRGTRSSHWVDTSGGVTRRRPSLYPIGVCHQSAAVAGGPCGTARSRVDDPTLQNEGAAGPRCAHGADSSSPRRATPASPTQDQQDPHLSGGVPRHGWIVSHR